MAREGFLNILTAKAGRLSNERKSAKIKGRERIGENLFFCNPIDRLPYFAVRGLMRSTTHRENILDGRWNSTGVGIAVARDGGIYITQIFLERWHQDRFNI